MDALTFKLKNRPYLSIKWQAFLLTSLVLGVMFTVILLALTESSKDQFEKQLSALHERNYKQFNSLLELEAEKASQLAHFTADNKILQNLIDTRQTEQLENLVEELAWTLQVEYGIDNVVVFDSTGAEYVISGQRVNDAFGASIISLEQSQWLLDCTQICSLTAGAPILFDGRVIGALAISEPLSNTLLKFHQVTGINTALLHPVVQSSSEDQVLEEWNHRLLAITNQKLARAILEIAHNQTELGTLLKQNQVIDLNQNAFLIRAFMLAETTVITIEDVSEAKQLSEQSVASMTWMLVLCLVVSECLLLVVLWRPMERLKLTTTALPSLAQKNYAQARSSFAQLASSRFLNDEAEVLRITATQVCTELDSMHSQLESRACELESNKRELTQERDFVHQLFDTMHAVIIIQDSEGYIRQANHYTELVTNMSKADLKGLHFARLIGDKDDLDEITKNVRQIADQSSDEYQHETELACGTSASRYLAWRHVPLVDQHSGNHHVLSIAVDITDRVEAEQELAWLAQHDTLSTLFNRHAFEQFLKEAFANTDAPISISPDDTGIAVMFIDLDDFKRINDTHGHHKGDEMIQAVAKVLNSHLRETDFAARVGGDEFALVIRKFHMYDLTRIAKRILASLGEIRLTPNIRCAASIGVATRTSLTKSPEHLIGDADSAMYQAKQSGKNQFVILNGGSKNANVS